jgi:pimeloyl-ACP methyl ester carboxylesterase
MKTWALDGVRMCYEESTLAGVNAAPIVFVHGWCCDHRHFAPQFGHFSARHHVVSVDQRGFGASDKPEQKYTIEGFADDLAALCRELRLEKPAIVGHSMGGAIALAFAARHPTLPRAIALCDPAILWHPIVRQSVGPLIEALGSPGYKEAAAAFMDQRLFGPSDPHALRARIVTDMCQTPQHVMRSAFASLFDFDSEAAARGCKVPTLLIDAEPPIPDRVKLRELCPQVMLSQTAGSGHFHQLVVPDQVNAMLERFLYTVR